MTDAPTAFESVAKPRHSRARRLVRLVAGGLAVILLVVGFSLWLVTRSWFIIGQIEPELERKLGGDVTIGKAAYAGGGRVIFEDVFLQADTLQGVAGRIASIGRAVVTVDLTKLVRGRVEVDDVQVSDVVLRLSEDSKGRFNFAALHPEWDDESDGRKTPPPRVLVRNASIEYGVHSKKGYVMHGQRRVSGLLYPTAGFKGWYNFELNEIDAMGRGLGEAGIFIKGDWNIATNEMRSRLDGLELNQSVYDMLPEVARAQWDLMALEGRVHGVIVDWHPEHPFFVELSVENMAMTLPFDTGELWARFRGGQAEPTDARPRINVNSGKMRLGSDFLVLEEVRGELQSSEASSQTSLIGVPYVINLTVPALPEMDWDNREQWLETVVNTTPFEMTFRMDEFRLKTEEGAEPPAVDLPALVTKVLAKFSMTDWVLSSTVQVRREPPVVNEDGTRAEPRLVTTGQAYIHKASGRYQKFPYQLDDVDAYMQFDNEKVTVHYLTGKGSGDSTFRITGEIKPPESYASVAMKVSATNVPLDDRLRAALKAGELEAFDEVFHRPSNESLAAAGLLPDAAALESLRQRRAELNEQAAALTANIDPADAAQAERAAALGPEIARLDRLLAAGPFALGGLIDLDLSVDRPQGPKQPTTLSGLIHIKSAGVLYEKFPYPVRVTGGSLNWQHDRVSIVENENGIGLPIILPGGGAGSVTGEIEFVKVNDKKKIRPNLRFTAVDDAITESIYAAIPMTKSERQQVEGASGWPGAARSKASRIVQGIGLSGALDGTGTISTDANNKVDFDFEVSLRAGRARPSTLLAESVALEGELWPADFELADMSGTLRVTRDAITWERIAGRREDVVVTTSGDINLRGDNLQNTVTVDFERLPLEPYVLNLASANERGQLQALWENYAPTGVFDARLRYTSGVGGAPSSTVFSAAPREVRFTWGDHRVAATHAGGAMAFSRAGIEFSDLAVNLQLDGSPAPQGTVILNGTLAEQNGARQMAIGGQWLGAQFESPLVMQSVATFASPRQAEQYRAYMPSGSFDAQFQTETGRDPIITIRPSELNLYINDTAVATTISAGEVVMRPTEIALKNLRGQHSEGAFDLDGVINTSGSIEANLHIGYTGRIRCDAVEAFLPEAARTALKAIEFYDRKPSTLRDGLLHLKRVEDAQTGAQRWRTDFSGVVETRSVSLTAGVPFRNVEGLVELDISHGPGAEPRLNIDAHAERALLLGLVLTNLHAPIGLSDDGTAIAVRGFRAQAARGTITADAAIGIGPRRDYEVGLELAGVPLRGFVMQQPLDEEATQGLSPGGEVYASASLFGEREKPASRRGRGVVRVLHGPSSSLPIALRALQLLQLTVPLASSLDYAEADMYLDGEWINFEKLLFESRSGTSASMQLFGEGVMNFDTLELNTRFRVRSGLAVIRDIVGGLGDALYTIEVTGPLSNPQARIVPLPRNQ